MSEFPHKSIFFAKTWYLYPGAILATLFFLFSLALGPLFLFEILKSQNGRPAPEAGVGLSIMALPMFLFAAMGWLTLYGRRQPVLRICREGIEINLTGASHVNGAMMLPGDMRSAWLILSFQGFERQFFWVPWESFRKVEITGPPMLRFLEIDAAIVYPDSHDDNSLRRLGDHIAFRDSRLQDQLEIVAWAILHFRDDLAARATLKSWRH